MAERATSKAKRTQQRGAADAARPGTAPAAAPSDALQRLEAELAAARAEIEELRLQRDQLANRIDWVIDSLHSLLEEER